MTFTRDRHSGSSDVANGFLDALERWNATDRSASAGDLRAALHTWLRAAQVAQPSMALVHQLAARALEIADTGVARGDAVTTLRDSLARSCAAEREDLVQMQAGAAGLAVQALRATGAWIATLSASGAVCAAFERAQKDGRRPSALVAESRPGFEGRHTASRLSAWGIPVWLVADAALPLLLSQATAVWLGADAVTDRGVINKIGSFATALAAREHSVPVYAIATRRKFLPASTAALRIDEMPPEEVWKEAPETVKPRNLYFELVPLSLFAGIVVEDAVLGATEAATLARERPLPNDLAGALP